MKNFLEKLGISKLKRKIKIHNEYHNPLYHWWLARKAFKFPEVKFYIGKKFWFYGFPLDRYINKYIHISKHSLGYKTKFGSFRHEHDPYFAIVLFKKWEFLVTFGYWGKQPDYCRNIATWEALLDYIYKKIPKEKTVNRHIWSGTNQLTTIEENIKWK